MSATVATVEDLEELKAEIRDLAEVNTRLVDLVERGIQLPLLIDEAEAVRLLGVPRTTVYKLRTAGHLTVHDVEGSNRYVRAEIEAFVAQLASASPTDTAHLRAV